MQFRYGMTGKLLREKIFRCPFQYPKVPLEAGCQWQIVALHCGRLRATQIIALFNTCLKCRGLTRASNIFNDFELSPSFSTGLNSNFSNLKVLPSPTSQNLPAKNLFLSGANDGVTEIWYPLARWRICQHVNMERNVIERVPLILKSFHILTTKIIR